MIILGSQSSNSNIWELFGKTEQFATVLQLFWLITRDFMLLR